MSAKATFWAWSLRGISSSQKLVLVCLADHHNADTNRCDPSVAFIADKTCLDRKSVMRATSALEQMGLLSVIKRPGTSDQFALNFEWGKGQKAEPTSTKSGTGKRAQTSTKSGTGKQAQTSTKSGTGTKCGTGTQSGPCGQLQTSTKCGTGPASDPPEPVPNVVHPPVPNVVPVPHLGPVPNVVHKSKTLPPSHSNNLTVREAGWRLGAAQFADLRHLRPDLVPDAEDVAACFVDHFASTGERRADWDARWRKWVREERRAGGAL